MDFNSDKYIDRLRQKTRVWLLNNESRFFGKHSNPFGKGLVPVMGEFVEDEPIQTIEAYESGNRSILFKHDGVWYKAKGIGIPVGVSRPIFRGRRIFTYQLHDDPGMCHKFILWGFMKKEEYQCELFGSERARELGQDIEIIGTSTFRDVRYISMKDRMELFKRLQGTDTKERIDLLSRKNESTSAYSAYYKVPTDIRVGELFFALMFPEVTKLIDPQLISEYVIWLGTTCGLLLRQFHDSGALHGTWVGPKLTSLGLLDIHSNSYTGNYLVGDDRLTMCDFDLAKPVERESEKETEKWALVHVENPLHYAGSYAPKDALIQGMAKKNPFREELARLFKESVDSGYGGEPHGMERKSTREMLHLFVTAKGALWDLYDLPKGLVGQVDYVDHVIATKKIDPKKIKDLKKMS